MLKSNLLQLKTPLITILKTTLKKPSQELIVALVTLFVVLLFGVLIGGFATKGNLITLIRHVSVLGILGVGMAIVVIGRGIDLSQVSVMAISSAWAFRLMQDGMSMPVALLLALALAMIVGVVNGYLIAFIEIPPLFVTLATGILFYGVGQLFMLRGEYSQYIPKGSESFLIMSKLTILGIPLPIYLLVLVSLIVHQFLSKTSAGRFIYAHGDSADAARMTGIGIRPLTILEYPLCAVIGYLAGMVRASMVGQVDIRVVTSTMIFDVILVVVLGGVSLIGGRGSIWSVLVGTALIGTLLNGMTLMNIPNEGQNIIKGLVLLGAIILDNRLHPRDEETARQGDI